MTKCCDIDYNAQLNTAHGASLRHLISQVGTLTLSIAGIGRWSADKRGGACKLPRELAKPDERSGSIRCVAVGSVRFAIGLRIVVDYIAVLWRLAVGRLAALSAGNRGTPVHDVITDQLPVVLDVIANDCVRVSETRLCLSFASCDLVRRVDILNLCDTSFFVFRIRPFRRYFLVECLKFLNQQSQRLVFTRVRHLRRVFYV